MDALIIEGGKHSYEIASYYYAVMFPGPVEKYLGLI